MKQITTKGDEFYYFYTEGSDYDIGKSKGCKLVYNLADMWENFTLPKMVEWYGAPPEKDTNISFSAIKSIIIKAPQLAVESMQGKKPRVITIEPVLECNNDQFSIHWDC